MITVNQVMARYCPITSDVCWKCCRFVFSQRIFWPWARPLHHSLRHRPAPLSRASEAPEECDTDTHDSPYGLMSAANTHSTPQWIRAIFHPTQLWRAWRHLHSHWAAYEYIWDPSWLFLSSLSQIYLSRCDKVEERTSCLGVIPHPHTSDYMSLCDKMLKFSGISYWFSYLYRAVVC